MEEKSLDGVKPEQSEQVGDTTEKNESKDEGTDELQKLKEENEKLAEERDNYKRGLLAAKEKRTLKAEEKEEKKEQKPEKKPEKVDDSDVLVDKAMKKMAERQAIAEILDPNSSDHIPECVDNKNWNQIVQYIPTGADKDTAAGVKRAMRIAVSAWKADTGQTDDSKEESKGNPAALGAGAGGDNKGEKPKSTLNIPKKNSIDDWFTK